LTPNAHKDKPESCAKIGIILETSKYFSKKVIFTNKTIRFFANFKYLYYLCSQNSNCYGSNIQRGLSGEALYQGRDWGEETPVSTTDSQRISKGHQISDSSQTERRFVPL
jgi:hypothetical protein